MKSVITRGSGWVVNTSIVVAIVANDWSRLNPPATAGGTDLNSMIDSYL